MGAAHPRYMQHRDAAEVMGEERWHSTVEKMERYAGRYMDFSTFHKIVTTHFEQIPKMLVEHLFGAFVSDTRCSGKVDVGDFVAGVAAATLTLALADGRPVHPHANLSNGAGVDVHKRFVFNVYDSSKQEIIERTRVESVIMTALADTTLASSQQVRRFLDKLFRNSPDEKCLTFQEFCAFNEPLGLMVEWIQLTLGALLEPLPSKLEKLERKYSTVREVDRMVDQYRISRETCEILRKKYYAKCVSVSAAKAEITEAQWAEWVYSYIPKYLATAIYRSKLGAMKKAWRFSEFVEFCVVCTRSGVSTDAQLFEYLFHALEVLEGSQGTVSTLNALLALAGLVEDDPPETEVARNGVSNESQMPFLPVTAAYATNMLTSREQIANVWRSEAESKEQVDNATFLSLLSRTGQKLPLVHRLEMCASCLFGLRPTDKSKEFVYLAELYTRYKTIHPSTSESEYGQPGTEWCLVASEWWNRWRRTHPPPTSQSASIMALPAATMTQTHLKAPSPNLVNSAIQTVQGVVSTHTYQQKLQSNPLGVGLINNWPILKKGSVTSQQLLTGVHVGQHCVCLPPPVWNALEGWYGGGPKVLRSVIRVGESMCELELYPLCLRIATCDATGKSKGMEIDLLFSRTLTVQQVLEDVCVPRRVDASCARLWNYASQNWKDQYIISPELTLEQAKLQDGQMVLLEVSLRDGTWPRSQLHASLEIEEKKATESMHAHVPINAGEDEGPLSPRRVWASVGDGHVGLDNLGNTCYLNASLQILLHTQPLVEYFLCRRHVRDINVTNPFGHKGRLAYAFGALAKEVWTTTKRSINPKYFKTELSKFNEHFAGSEQHDAQELLAFLLDGLSEDVNRVAKKPYIENPDSDNRPDAELAEIWWDNHLKRELSIIVALFTGQFKSIVVCPHCNFESARFEPFSVLQVPLPEDQCRTMVVNVVGAGPNFKPIRCSVRVNKTGTVQDIVSGVAALQLRDVTAPYFIVAEISYGRVSSLVPMHRALHVVRDIDTLFLYNTPHSIGVETEPDAPASTGTVVSIVVREDGEQENTDSFQVSQSQPEVNVQVEEPTNTDLLQQQVPPPPPPAPSDEENGSRVYAIVLQRRVQSFDALGPFKMERFGLPIVDLLPRVCTGLQLYDMLAPKVSRVLKCDYPLPIGTGTVTDDRMTWLHPSAGTGEDSMRWLKRDVIEPISNDDAVAGPIPPYGFVLRTVTAGGGVCSRCHWLDRCDGCLIPFTNMRVELRDGETLAVDWHYVVFQELVDMIEAQDCDRHESLVENASLDEKPLPLYQCLDKFTEEEKVDEIVCSKCHESGMNLTYSFWRLPPVMVIHLKRFQFTRYARRKLHNLVQYPIDGLDLSRYITPSRREQLSQINTHTDTETDTPASADANADPDPSQTHIPTHTHTYTHGMECLMDLYAVIHHIGALGGGHYVASVRDYGTDTWRCYNDGLVSEISVKDLNTSSAYMLFYTRRDLAGVSFSRLFPDLPGFEGPLSEEAFEKLMRKRDQIACSFM